VTQTLQRGPHDRGVRWMDSLDSERRLDREPGDACGAEESMRSEDHQVCRHPGSGGRIEAGDREDCLHGSEDRKRENQGK